MDDELDKRLRRIELLLELHVIQQTSVSQIPRHMYKAVSARMTYLQQELWGNIDLRVIEKKHYD